MNNWLIFNTPTTGHSILPPKNILLELVLVLPPLSFNVVYGPQKDEAKLKGDEKKESTFVDKIK